MVDSVPFFISLPEDINFKIASLLQVPILHYIFTFATNIIMLQLLFFLFNVLSGAGFVCFSCCSKFWRQVCFSDSIWHRLLTNRWPLLHSPLSPNLKTWRRLYFERHIDLGLRAASVERFLKGCSRNESLEVDDYLQAIEIVNGARFGFEDIQRFLFKPGMNVLVNLVGVHYCITNLGIQGDDLVQVLRTCEISDRHVCIRWWKLGRWIHGYRGRDESLFRWISLEDLVTEEDESVLRVVRRGTVLEVLRVQISAVDHKSIPWSYQDNQ